MLLVQNLGSENPDFSIFIFQKGLALIVAFIKNSKYREQLIEVLLHNFDFFLADFRLVDCLKVWLFNEPYQPNSYFFNELDLIS